MKYNFKALDPRPTDIKYEHDLLGLVDHMFVDEDSDFDKVERLLSEANRLLILNNVAKQYKDDKGLESLVGLENIELATSTESFVSGLRRITDSMNTLTDKMYKVIWAKTVSEKYIYKRFDKLKERLAEADTERAMVFKVPSYETCTKRFIGVMNVAGFLEEISNRPPEDQIFQDTLFEKVVSMSNGVLKVTAPNKESGLKNLVWNPPILTEYDVLHSPWNDNQKREQLRNLIIKCKYQGSDSFKKAAKSVKKTTQKQIEMQTPYDEDYGSGMGYGSSPEEEYSKQLKTYSVVFLLSKLCKQAEKNAIEKEVNVFCISYIHRLCSYKDF